MNNVKSSYTAADAIPLKIIRDAHLIETITTYNVIPPVHPQVIPTNLCNLNCKFCSCAEEDRSLSMPLIEMLDMLVLLKKLGAKAITITGGGEPLMYPYLEEMLKMCVEFCNIKVGLVTNGMIMDPYDSCMDYLTWCRISHGDSYHDFNKTYTQNITNTIARRHTVDWAYSYVVGTEPNIDRIVKLIEFANMWRLTHIRLVADLLHPEQVPMLEMKKEIQTVINKSKVPIIVQERNTPEHGQTCYMPYLKPVIGADMKVYACCGAQYAFDPMPRKLPEELCLGKVVDLDKIIKTSCAGYKAGNKCTRCYYGSYNRILESLLNPMDHGEFM